LQGAHLAADGGDTTFVPAGWSYKHAVRSDGGMVIRRRTKE
jgi:hypothetical protein